MTAGLEEHCRSVAQGEGGVATGVTLGVDGGGEEGGTERTHFALIISMKIKKYIHSESCIQLHM